MDTAPGIHQPFRSTDAVVTGASSGIGRAIAVELAKQGAERLLVHYRGNRKGAEETVERLDSLGCEGVLCRADLALDQEVDALIEFAFSRLDRVCTWVNNAGVDVLTGAASEWSFQKKLETLLRVDLVGTARLSRAVTDIWRQEDRVAERSPPSMVFIGWDQAPLGMEGDAGQMFGSVKASVMAFAKSLAQDVAPGIRVNTVSPGWIQTSWGTVASDYWDRRARSQALMQRWGRPDDVARAVAFAACPENDFFHGQSVNVNGGWSRKFES